MKIFISGGTGTLGKQITASLMDLQHINTALQPEKIVIYSRDEAKHAAMRELYPEGPPGPVRYRIGDICDPDRLVTAMQDCTHVIHTAALKRIDTCEREPYDAARVNVTGTINVATACRRVGIQQALYISTDKACDSVSVYGATKQVGERLWVQANMYGGCRYSAVRYGNVLGSRGSVAQTWRAAAAEGKPLMLMHKDMTRFFWSISEAAEFVIKKFLPDQWETGVVYVPKLQAYKMLDLAKQYSEDIQILNRLRTNEKVHEILVSSTEVRNCYDQGAYYVIYPAHHDWDASQDKRGTRVAGDFRYSSSG